MPTCRPELAKKARRCLEARGRSEWQPWLWAAFVMIFPIALACWCKLVLPGQTTLVKNILVSAVTGDARYWTTGQWRADAMTLNAARRWMFDPESAAVVEAEVTAPTVLVSTNSEVLKPTV